MPGTIYCMEHAVCLSNYLLGIRVEHFLQCCCCEGGLPFTGIIYQVFG